MIRIWGRNNSSNVKKALWAAKELELEFDHINVGGAFGGLDDPAFLAKNPNGLVPLLEDGDTVLWESNTIVRYLAARYGQDRLWIADPASRAQAEKWMDWASTTLAGDFRAVMLNLVRLPVEQRNPSQLEIGKRGLEQAFTLADKALAGADWFSGAQFGIGDIPLGCLAYGWFEFPMQRPSLPNLEAWYKRLAERPAFRETVMIPLT